MDTLSAFTSSQINSMWLVIYTLVTFLILLVFRRRAKSGRASGQPLRVKRAPKNDPVLAIIDRCYDDMAYRRGDWGSWVKEVKVQHLSDGDCHATTLTHARTGIVIQEDDHLVYCWDNWKDWSVNGVCVASSGCAGKCIKGPRRYRRKLKRLFNYVHTVDEGAHRQATLERLNHQARDLSSS